MRWKRNVFAAVFVILLGTGAAWAREIQQGDQCVIAAERTIEGNLFVLCRTLIINGTVTGNLIGAATSAVINGTVDGDLYMIAAQLDLRGTVGEDVHFAGPVLRIHEDSDWLDEDADLIAFSLSTNLYPGGEIPGSIVGLGYQLILDGSVGGEVSFWGSSLLVNGHVGGDIDAAVGDINADVSQLQTLLIPVPLDVTLNQPGLVIGEDGRIDGQLSYEGPSEAEIPPGALALDAIYIPVLVQPDFTQIALSEEERSRGVGIYLAQVLREFITLTVVGIIALVIAPRALQAPLHNLQARPLPCLGIGLVTFIVALVAVPIAVFLTVLIVVAVSVLQINELTFAIAAIFGVIDLGGASVIFFVVIFLSRLILCLALGRGLVRMVALRRFGKETRRDQIVSLLLGVLLASVMISLPLIGWVINAISAFLGLGAILTIIQARAEAAREAASVPRYTVDVHVPALPRSTEEKIVPPPPPMISDEQRSPGTDNLPEGFQWWSD